MKESQDKLDSLNAFVASELAKKKELEDSANRMKRKTGQANKLISSLSDEKIRWTEDSNNFADTKRRLVGDVAVATAFVSYCGPFNSEFRNMLMKDYFISDLK